MRGPSRRSVLAAFGGSGLAVAGSSDAGRASASDRADETSASNEGFATDFDFPAPQLADHGWRVANGRYTTRDSYLLADAGANEQPHVYHDQPRAAGTFELRGIQNRAKFFGVRWAFVGSRKRIEGRFTGYMINFRQHRHGDVRLVRVDGDGSELLLTLAADHGGAFHDVRVERDPATYEFTCCYDGCEVGRVRDDTYTESSYCVVRLGGALGSQRIDGIAANPANARSTAATGTARTDRPTVDSSTEPSGAGTQPPTLSDWLDGWYSLFAWLAAVPLLGPLVLGALVWALDDGRADDGV